MTPPTPVTPATVVLCPGQGAQAVGMGRDFYDASPEARAVFDEAADVLGVDLKALCFDGPEDKLGQTDVAQPAIFTTSVACHAAARARGVVAQAGSEFAGLSLGEYTALHLAGVFDFATGLRLVAARGRYMQEAALAQPGGMVSLVGGDDAAAEALCARAAETAGGVLVTANYNCPGQVVASGSVDACAAAERLAGEAGMRAVVLKVAGAFHSPLMQPAADRLRDDLDGLEFAPPSARVWSNVTAAPHADPASIKALLVRQLTEPVRWSQTTRQLADAGRAFVELAPGRVLSGLLRKTDRRAGVVSLNTVEALQAADA